MKIWSRFVPAATLVAVLGGALAAGGHAGASPPPSFPGGGHAVFVQTDNPTGNEVVAYSRAPGGQLAEVGTYATGGLGGQLGGSVVDHLASEGSLTLDQGANLLFAVNAGSNTLSVFDVRGDQLRLSETVPSGGSFPVSVAVSGGLVYVLNAGGGGSLQGFFVVGDRLWALPGSSRALGLDPTATPPFTNSPGQVGFTPNGSQVVVTTKANGSDIDVFGVGPFGELSPRPVVNAVPGTVPFGFAFTASGDLAVTEAGPDALATFRILWNGSIAPVASLADGQAATCWVTGVDGYLFASNAGSADVTAFRPSFQGQLSIAGTTATDPGTVDAAASPDGRDLYVQTGGLGIVDEFAVGPSGSLNRLGSVTVPGAVGGEGIAAS